MNTSPEAAPNAALSWPVVFLSVLKRIDKSKLNGHWMALRNALAVSIPLALGIALGNPLAGVAIATGALNVAYSDGRDPYAHRARRMLSWSLLGAFAVFLGSVTGNYPVLAILLAAGWAFLAGLLVSISTRAGDLGLNTLVALIVYAARGAMSPKGAFYAGLLVLGGGLLQMLFALLSWPVRHYAPERRAIGSVYLSLAQEAKAHPDAIITRSLRPTSSDVQDVLSALGRDHSLEGERFRLLLDQADRLRLSMYNLSRMRGALSHEARLHDAGPSTALEQLDGFGELSCELLESIAHSLLDDNPGRIRRDSLAKLRMLVNRVQQLRRSHPAPLLIEFAAAADVLTGQLRVVAQLAGNTTGKGAEEFARTELAPPLNLQLRSWLATLRANLSLQSPAFRHGIRLAVCVAIGDVIGRSIGVQRNYWLAMTVAVVLKPDFTTTLSRGVLRLSGTFAGLLLATAFYHLLPQGALTQLLLVSVFTYVLRYAGAANYGIFSLAISGLIVFLIAVTGVPPIQVIGERAINTVAGGVFALIAYALWPTWERSQISEVIAEMIDRSRDYFHLVVLLLCTAESSLEQALDVARDAWRQARSAAEASVDRYAAEPWADARKLDALTSILASSHALVRVILGLEAAFVETGSRFVPSAFQDFAHDVEFTLYFLSSALRGSVPASQTLPQLRDDHRLIENEYKKLQAPDDFILIETDRLTVALNTLREQVIRYDSVVRRLGPEPAHATVS